MLVCVRDAERIKLTPHRVHVTNAAMEENCGMNAEKSVVCVPVGKNWWRVNQDVKVVWKLEGIITAR
jgi:hypothetical protein